MPPSYFYVIWLNIFGVVFFLHFLQKHLQRPHFLLVFFMTHFMELLLCWAIQSWAISKATSWSEVWLCWRTSHFSCFIFILSLDFHKSYLQAETGFPCFPIWHDVRKNTAFFFCLPWPPINTTQIKIHIQCLADAFHQSTEIKYICLSRRILFFCVFTQAQQYWLHSV